MREEKLNSVYFSVLKLLYVFIFKTLDRLL